MPPRFRLPKLAFGRGVVASLFALSIFYLLIAQIFMFGEIAWLVLLSAWLIMGFLAFESHRGRAAAACLGAAILFAHFAGFKIYGEPPIYDNRAQLGTPQRLVGVEAPNLLLMDSGARLEVHGVIFTKDLLELPHEELLWQLNHSDRRSYVRGTADSVFIQSDASSPSGVTILRRHRYWCGNEFFPRFFPNRLPTHFTADIGPFVAEFHKKPHDEKAD